MATTTCCGERALKTLIGEFRGVLEASVSGHERRLRVTAPARGDYVIRGEGRDGDAPLLRGSGRWTYRCGGCDAVVAEGLMREHLSALLACPSCGACNDAGA